MFLLLLRLGLHGSPVLSAFECRRERMHGFPSASSRMGKEIRKRAEEAWPSGVGAFVCIPGLLLWSCCITHFEPWFPYLWNKDKKKKMLPFYSNYGIIAGYLPQSVFNLSFHAVHGGDPRKLPKSPWHAGLHLLPFSPSPTSQPLSLCGQYLVSPVSQNIRNWWFSRTASFFVILTSPLCILFYIPPAFNGEQSCGQSCPNSSSTSSLCSHTHGSWSWETTFSGREYINYLNPP